VNLLNARDGMFEGVNGRDQPPFHAVCHRITLRTHVGPYDHRVSDSNSSCFRFPGYPSSTEVEKTPKKPGETGAPRSRKSSLRTALKSRESIRDKHHAIGSSPYSSFPVSGGSSM
jgi:hypothetical protein